MMLCAVLTFVSVSVSGRMTGVEEILQRRVKFAGQSFGGRSRNLNSF